MQTKIIEASQNLAGGLNHGKFLIGRFDETEYSRKDIGGYALIAPRWGYGNNGHLIVLDLETGEGAIFKPGGFAKADLNKHKIWVCPMFEPFLEWLYQQDPESWIHPGQLPDTVELPDAPFEMAGYRRTGPTVDETPRTSETE